MTSEASIVVFPKVKPTKQILIRIQQLEWELRESKTVGMLAVWGFINLAKRSTENPYYWCDIPIAYRKAVNIALLRYEILKIASFDTVSKGGQKEHIVCAMIHLAYLDKMLAGFFDDALESPELEGRFNSFDKWIRTEFHVGKHSPDDVSVWELLNPNIDLGVGAIKDLGNVLNSIASPKHVANSVFN
jgi:hypothetical protein